MSLVCRVLVRKFIISFWILVDFVFNPWRTLPYDNLELSICADTGMNLWGFILSRNSDIWWGTDFKAAIQEWNRTPVCDDLQCHDKRHTLMGVKGRQWEGVKEPTVQVINVMLTAAQISKTHFWPRGLKNCLCPIKRICYFEHSFKKKKKEKKRSRVAK